LVQSRSFSPEDCYPTRGNFLQIPTKISFAELWGTKKGRKSFVEVVKMTGGGRGAGRFGGVGGGRGAGGGRVPPVAPAVGVIPAAPLQGVSADLATIKNEFPQAMMQQLGAAAPGMFPMMQPDMWIVPMSQWSQFYGNQQIPPAAFNPMMMLPQGFPHNVPQSSNSHGSSVSLNPSRQQ
jgi:hypothetical protein